MKVKVEADPHGPGSIITIDGVDLPRSEMPEKVEQLVAAFNAAGLDIDRDSVVWSFGNNPDWADFHGPFCASCYQMETFHDSCHFALRAYVWQRDRRLP